MKTVTRQYFFSCLKDRKNHSSRTRYIYKVWKWFGKFHHFKEMAKMGIWQERGCSCQECPHSCQVLEFLVKDAPILVRFWNFLTRMPPFLSDFEISWQECPHSCQEYPHSCQVLGSSFFAEKQYFQGIESIWCFSENFIMVISSILL